MSDEREPRRPFTPPPKEPPTPREEEPKGVLPEPTPAESPEPEPPAGGLSAGASLNAALAAWQEHMRREGFSEHTIRAFTSDLRILAKYAGPGTAVGDFTTQGLNDFLKWDQTGRGVSITPKTFARRITAIKSFFRWLTGQGVLTYDPAEPVIQHSVQSPLPDYLSLDEMERCREAAMLIRNGTGGKKPDIRPYVLFHLLLQSGIKKGECLSLIPEHIDLTNPDEPVIFVRYNSPRQRFKERKLKLNADWAAAYREYMLEHKPQTQVFPWSPRRLEYMLEDIGKLAGLEKRLSFDCLRWTSAVHDRLAGTEPDKIRQKMGLSKIQWREIGAKIETLAREAGGGEMVSAGSEAEAEA